MQSVRRFSRCGRTSVSKAGIPMLPDHAGAGSDGPMRPHARRNCESIPEILRGRAVLFGERLHHSVDGTRWHALAFKLLDPRFGNLGADLAELGALLGGQLDRLRPAVNQQLLADAVEPVPRFAHL